jgi:hypothetical protein
MSFDSEERRGDGEAMTIRLGSPDFLRMFPTVVWTLQLDEEATRAINPGILRRVAGIQTSAAEPSTGENWQSGHALYGSGGRAGPGGNALPRRSRPEHWWFWLASWSAWRAGSW